MRLVLSYDERTKRFQVDCPRLPGAQPVGRGDDMITALGEWLLNNQTTLGIFIDVDESAQWAEDARREQAMAER